MWALADVVPILEGNAKLWKFGADSSIVPPLRPSMEALSKATTKRPTPERMAEFRKQGARNVASKVQPRRPPRNGP